MGLRGNARRWLREIFGCILWRCGRCLELSVASRSVQPGRKAARQGEEYKSLLGISRHRGGFLFMFGAHLRAEVPGAPLSRGTVTEPT